VSDVTSNLAHLWKVVTRLANDMTVFQEHHGKSRRDEMGHLGSN